MIADTMGGGNVPDKTFLEITNRDIFNKIEKLEALIVEERKILGRLQSQVKWHQRIGLFVIGSAMGAFGYIIRLLFEIIGGK